MDGWSTDYYELPEGAEELQDLIEHRDMNFAMGNIFKACYRYGHKRNTSREYDLNKIIWYANRELRRIRELQCQPENPQTPTTRSITPAEKPSSKGRPVIEHAVTPSERAEFLRAMERKYTT